jgi:tetratricopeptide (TPR) repeat protein
MKKTKKNLLKHIIASFVLFSLAFFAQAQNTKEYEAGKKAYQAQNYKEAITQLGKVLAKTPTHIMSRYYRGLSYGEMKFYKESLKDLDEAIKAMPMNADFYFQRAMIKKAKGDKQQAISDLDNAIILDEKQANYFLERANLLSANNQYGEAALDLAKIQMLNPEDQEVRANFRAIFEKVPAVEREELSQMVGLTAAGMGDKPLATAIPDDKNTIEEKRIISERKFKSVEEGKQYFMQLKAKQGFATGKKNMLLGLLRVKVLQDVFGENPFAEDVENMKYYVDTETWLGAEGKKYYFNLVSDSKYWFSNGIQRKNIYYFYKAMRYKNSEKYRLQVYAVANNESNLVMSGEVKIKEDSTYRSIIIPHAQNKGYMWAVSSSNFLEAKVELASNQESFQAVGNMVSFEDSNHGISQDQYNQWIIPTDKSLKSNIKAALNYLVIQYPKAFTKL